jgi:hypothetical protein
VNYGEQQGERITGISPAEAGVKQFAQGQAGAFNGLKPTANKLNRLWETISRRSTEPHELRGNLGSEYPIRLRPDVAEERPYSVFPVLVIFLV